MKYYVATLLFVDILIYRCLFILQYIFDQLFLEGLNFKEIMLTLTIFP